jgi:acyl-CoA reductase-like NAD-dependent aldehyde dehydrogenase
MTSASSELATPQIDGIGPTHFIDGRPVGSAASHPVFDPATGQLIVDAPLADADQLNEAVASAKRASASWAADAAKRSELLIAMADAMTQERPTLARLLTLETGLPISVATDEVAMAEIFLRSRAKQVLPVDILADNAREHVELVRKPTGIVAAIIPWNAPMMIACEKIGSAFAAGNCVVMKPSPLAPLTLLHFARLVQAILPTGVLHILNGDNDLGTALVAHDHVAMISFTGSIRAGREIMAAAAPGLKRLSLELGGNDAAILLDDIDVRKTAAKLFFAAFYRGGQVCAAVKRLYVPRALQDPVLDALSAMIKQVVLGDPFAEGTTMGPISNRPQFERVDGLVRAAVEAGGTVAIGGHPLDRPGFFFAPTIVTADREDNPLVAQEQFGPALPVIAYDDVEEALSKANATSFGLGGSIWTEDIERGLALARRLDAGSAWVNRHGMVQPDIPFGGMKQSGIGRANGAPGLDAYTELQTLSVALPKK